MVGNKNTLSTLHKSLIYERVQYRWVSLRSTHPTIITFNYTRYLQHLVDEDGCLRAIQQGISLGCPISPLMGAVYLKPLDDALTHSGWFYTRFMDDWVVLVPTRGKLRQAIKRANAVLEELKVEKHPDKTYIGRVAHGFDFLGYPFDLQASNGLIITAKTLNNYGERLRELAMQGADAEQMAHYRKHWLRWVQSGVTLRWVNWLRWSILNDIDIQRIDLVTFR